MSRADVLINNTLADLKRNGVALCARCEIDEKCRYQAKLDLDKLIALLGEDFPIISGQRYLESRLRCRGCHRRGKITTWLSYPLHPNTFRIVPNSTS